MSLTYICHKSAFQQNNINCYALELLTDSVDIRPNKMTQIHTMPMGLASTMIRLTLPTAGDEPINAKTNSNHQGEKNMSMNRSSIPNNTSMIAEKSPAVLTYC